jgi:hypothetical protein
LLPVSYPALVRASRAFMERRGVRL